MQCFSIDLRDVAVAFPEDIKGRRYRLERKATRVALGSVEAVVARTGGESGYEIVVDFITGERIMARSRGSNTIDVFAGDRRIGRVVSNRSDIAEVARPMRWSVYLHEDLWGTVSRAGITIGQSLAMRTVDGEEWPIRVGRVDRFSDFLKALLSLLTLSIWRPQPVNLDTVIPQGTPTTGHTDRCVLFFAVNLVFRMLVLPHDFGYSS